jgi:hypothetical protein
MADQIHERPPIIPFLLLVEISPFAGSVAVIAKSNLRIRRQRVILPFPAVIGCLANLQSLADFPNCAPARAISSPES